MINFSQNELSKRKIMGLQTVCNLSHFWAKYFSCKKSPTFFKSISEALMVFIRPKSSVLFFFLGMISFSKKKTQQKTNYGTLDCWQNVKFLCQVLFVQKITNFFKSISEALFIFMRPNWSITN